MPDDRLFHKRLGHSDKVSRLTDFEFIVWCSYVLSADDFGVLRFSAVTLQSDHDRLAGKSPKTVQRALDVVRDAALIDTFTHQGRVYGFQPDWQDWQHVDYPRATIHPAPPADCRERCSEATRKLFDIHPGGWRGKRRHLQENLPKVSGEPSEGVSKVSATPDRKPLAVSRKPLAYSREPLIGTDPPPTNARSKRPVYQSDRFVVFEWMFDELSKMLGSHFEDFGLDAFFDDLSRQSRDSGLVIPRADAWPWLQSQVLAEVQRRQLPIASAEPPPVDRKAAQRAQDERILAEIQQDRIARAGR